MKDNEPRQVSSQASIVYTGIAQVVVKAFVVLHKFYF